MNFLAWLTSAKAWIVSWFSDENKARVLAVLNMVSGFVDYALPIVKKIDEELKPLLDGDIPLLDVVQKFLEDYGDEIDDVVELAKKLVDLPMADMLANIALELLKGATPTTASLSALRLAIELAYNIYKNLKDEEKAKVSDVLYNGKS